MLDIGEEQKLKIVLVDDSITVCERLLGMLDELPEAEVVGQAHTATEAIELIRMVQPNLITLDIHMPGVPGLRNGIDLLRMVKQEYPQTVVIMLTNLVQMPYRRKCLEAGADYFFDKSSEFYHILPVVTEVFKHTGV